MTVGAEFAEIRVLDGVFHAQNLLEWGGAWGSVRSGYCCEAFVVAVGGGDDKSGADESAAAAVHTVLAQLYLPIEKRISTNFYQNL